MTSFIFSLTVYWQNQNFSQPLARQLHSTQQANSIQTSTMPLWVTEFPDSTSGLSPTARIISQRNLIGSVDQAYLMATCTPQITSICGICERLCHRLPSALLIKAVLLVCCSFARVPPPILQLTHLLSVICGHNVQQYTLPPSQTKQSH